MNDKHPKCLEFIRLGKKGEDIYRSYHYGIDFPISKEMAIERFKYKSQFKERTSNLLDNFRFQLELDEENLTKMHNNYLKDLERKLEEELEEFELTIEENILKSYPELLYAYTIYKYVMDLWNEGKWDPEWWRI